MHLIKIAGVILASSFLIGRGAVAQVVCGDCDADGNLSLTDLVRSTHAALGETAACDRADANGDGVVAVDDLVLAIVDPAGTCDASATPTPQLPPTEPIALRAWLQQGRYLAWHAESKTHRSGGPHGGMVRTYLNDIAFDSLLAGNSQHPQGAAVIKELYYSQSTPQEWAVETKLEDDSANGANWYWYEGAGLSGRGLGICTGCHGRDYFSFRSKDFILTPFPLQ